MRRFCALAAAALLWAALWAGFPGTARALPDTFCDPSCALGYSRAEEAVRGAVDTLYAAALEHQALVPLSLPREDAETALSLLMYDFPELYELDDPSLWLDGDTCTGVTLHYTAGLAEARAYREALLEQVLLLAGEAAGTDREKALSLHDRLCSLVTYGGESPAADTPVGALLNGQAQCRGYAGAYCLLLRAAGIPAGVVTGTDHAWNEAVIGGETLFTDVTWDDGDPVLHTWFCLTEEEMAADHTR